MKLFKYLMSVMLLATLVSCEPEEEQKVDYVTLDSIANTLWYSVNTKTQVYYDITYDETTGTMVGYSNSLRDEEVSRRSFSYTFTPARDGIDAIVNVVFDDGQRYGGILIPKGYLQINKKDVFIIQLYEVDENGEIIYEDFTTNVKSSIMMWKE